MSGNLHTLAVRKLYKHILQLHKNLPKDLRSLGDEYIKSEFKQHKNCTKERVPEFMQEWFSYAKTLEVQVASSKLHEDKYPKQTVSTFGRDLKPENLDNFSGDQIIQLHELMTVSTKKTET